MQWRITRVPEKFIKVTSLSAECKPRKKKPGLGKKKTPIFRPGKLAVARKLYQG